MSLSPLGGGFLKYAFRRVRGLGWFRAGDGDEMIRGKLEPFVLTLISHVTPSHYSTGSRSPVASVACWSHHKGIKLTRAAKPFQIKRP